MPREHGLPSTYAHGCHCELCTRSFRIWSKHRYRRRVGIETARPELTTAWRTAHDRGLALRFTDHIIATRPFPLALLRELAR